MDNKKWPDLLGKAVVVFDSNLWQKAGGDIGDNSCFRRLATVFAQNGRFGYNATVDVEWITGGISKSHFISAIQYSSALDVTPN